MSIIGPHGVLVDEFITANQTLELGEDGRIRAVPFQTPNVLQLPRPTRTGRPVQDATREFMRGELERLDLLTAHLTRNGIGRTNAAD